VILTEEEGPAWRMCKTRLVVLQMSQYATLRGFRQVGCAR
jgi:hypothetical protein